MANRFLQNREDSFYAKYLEQLSNETFEKNSVVAKLGKEPDSVFFIMKGIVYNETTERYYKAGQHVNMDCVFQKTLITQHCIANTEVLCLKCNAATFLKICEQFPDIQEDVKKFL